MGVISQSIRLRIGQHEFSLINVNYRAETFDITSSYDPPPMYMPGPEYLECEIDFDANDFESLYMLLGKQTSIYFDGGHVRLDRTGRIQNVRHTYGTHLSTIEFTILLGAPPLIDSWWWIYAEDDQKNDVAYLGVAMDWHLEHGQDDIADQFRKRIHELGKPELTVPRQRFGRPAKG